MDLGFIGVGSMGQPMCGRLIDAGHQLTVHDVRPESVEPLAERQVRVADSAKAVAAQSDIVFASLPGLEVYRDVALGTDGIREGGRAKIFVNLGTIGVQLVQDIADDLAADSIVTIDCPISGGPPGAAAGTLSVMASGPEAAFREVEPLLAALGTVTYIGDKAGMAQSVKLVNNILSATALTASSEAIVMGIKAGIDPEIILQAINVGSGRNSATLEKFPSDILTNEFNYGAALDILVKDVDLALAEGEGMGVPMPVSQAVRQLLRLVRAQLGGQADITNVAKSVAEWADTQIPKTR